MRTKLTLRLDKKLIEQVKAYAAYQGKSVSQIVADYFRVLTADKKKSPLTSAPVTQSLRGILRDSSLDAGDYKAFLEEKYR